MKTLTQSRLCVIVMADNRTAELCFENMEVLDIFRQPMKAEKKAEAKRQKLNLRSLRKEKKC